MMPFFAAAQTHLEVLTAYRRFHTHSPQLEQLLNGANQQV
jgi:hypothetical protein